MNANTHFGRDEFLNFLTSELETFGMTHRYGSLSLDAELPEFHVIEKNETIHSKFLCFSWTYDDVIKIARIEAEPASPLVHGKSDSFKIRVLHLESLPVLLRMISKFNQLPFRVKGELVY